MKLTPQQLLLGGAAAAVLVLLLTSSASAKGRRGGRMRAIESPGGGRIRDKRTPPDSELVNVKGAGGKALRAHRDAWAQYEAMRTAAHAAGVDRRFLGVHSALRDRAKQTRLFADAVKRYGSEAAARKWVAPPGGSAHESGRAFDLDLDGGGISSSRVAAMRKSKAWQWLSQNAVRFGFYPYEAEPWHWEYNPPAGGGVA